MARRMLAFITLFTIVTVACARSLGSSQISLEKPSFPTPDIPYTFRQATYADLNDITDVIIDAFDPSVEWKYNYQFKDEYPIYHRECFRQFLLSRWNELEDLDNVVMNVIEVPIDDDSSTSSTLSRTSRIVAIGLWQIHPASANSDSKESGTDNTLPLPFFLPSLSASNDEPVASASSFSTSEPVLTWPNCSLHLDANYTRAEDFSAQFAVAKQKYIDVAYPSGQVYLALLATHPDYDGHNFGATHCRWGMDLAVKRVKGEPVTLMATPEGYPLYKSLGFEEVKNVTLEFLDGLGGSWSEVMRWGYRDVQDGDQNAQDESEL